jgi:hypothetical protein
MRAAIDRLCNANVRAMHPRHTASVVQVGAAIGVEHPPGLTGAIPHHHWVRRAIVYWIAEQRHRSSALRRA